MIRYISQISICLFMVICFIWELLRLKFKIKIEKNTQKFLFLIKDKKVQIIVYIRIH
jgi:hypothetical protein